MIFQGWPKMLHPQPCPRCLRLLSVPRSCTRSARFLAKMMLATTGRFTATSWCIGSLVDPQLRRMGPENRTQFYTIRGRAPQKIGSLKVLVGKTLVEMLAIHFCVSFMWPAVASHGLMWFLQHATLSGYPWLLTARLHGFKVKQLKATVLKSQQY